MRRIDRGARGHDPVIAFYLFAAILLRGRGLSSCAQPGAFGAVADRRLLQRGGADGAGGRGIHRDAAGHRLCRRGRGAVPVRRDDARHRFRRTARRLHAQLAAGPAACGVLADRTGAGRRRLSARASAELGTPDGTPCTPEAPNIEAIGALLYTKYLFLFEAAGSSCWSP
jgi:hypothetical protein